MHKFTDGMYYNNDWIIRFVENYTHVNLSEVGYRFTHLNNFIFFWEWWQTLAFIVLYALWFGNASKNRYRIQILLIILIAVLWFGIMGSEVFFPAMLAGGFLLLFDWLRRTQA